MLVHRDKGQVQRQRSKFTVTGEKVLLEWSWSVRPRVRAFSFAQLNRKGFGPIAVRSARRKISGNSEAQRAPDCSAVLD